MKKIFELFFFGILFVLVLTSCQTPSEQSDETPTDGTEPNNPGNDDFGDGKRAAEVFWSDYLGDASDISCRGTLCFVK